MENWIDDDDEGGGSNLGQSNWKKVYEYIDNGDWGKEGKECSVKKDQIITCGGPIATFRWDDARDECSVKKDQIITCGGPIATFRWDDARDVDFKFLSVREIDPLKDIR